MVTEPVVGIVTVTFNSGEVIEPFLRSVLSQNYSQFLLYIVDNKSVDATIEQVSAHHDTRIRLIPNKENVGIAEANNQGTRCAIKDGCKTVLLINNDTEFGTELLQRLLEGLNQYKCDMIAPKILYHDDQRKIWSAGGGFDPRKGYGGFHYGLNEVDKGQYDRARAVDHAPACCLLVSKEVFSRVGFMDERYFVYLDDTDFCYRAKKAGMKLVYLPQAVLFHKASTLTGGPESAFSVRYRTRNQIYFMLKHLGVWRALYYLPAYQVYLFARIISGKISISTLLLREKAFVEGLRTWRDSVVHS